MYRPTHFAPPDAASVERLVRAYPLATLVVVAEGGLLANHLPLQLVREAGATRLLGHLARANPLARMLAGGLDALAIFHGPEHYVSPGWYPGKAEDGRAVPTWNYCVVHAHGRLQQVQDALALRELLAALTDAHEAGEARPWHIDDAPADYLEAMLRGVVGIELRVDRLEGKWKLSQNQPERNRAGVVRSLEARGGEAAGAMARLVADPASLSRDD